MIDWQVLSIPLYGGVDTKTDAALVDTSKLLKLENGVFSVKERQNKRTAISKRNGYAQKVGTSDTVAIASSQEQLLTFDPTIAYSYSEKQQARVSTGTVEVLKVRQTDLNRPPILADGQDFTQTNGVRADVCINIGITEIRFLDVVTGTVLFEDSVGSGFINSKLITCGDYIHHYSIENSTDLQIRVYNTKNLSVAIPTTISSSLSNGSFDVSGDNQKTVVAWVESGGINVAYYTKQGVQGSPLVNGLPDPVLVTVAAAPSWVSIRYFENTPTGDLVYIGHIEAALEVVFNGLNENFTTNFGPISFYVGSGISADDPIRGLTFQWNGLTEVKVFVDIGLNASTPKQIGFGIVDLSGATVNALNINWSVGTFICGKSFLLNGLVHVPALKFSQNQIQNTLLILFENGPTNLRFESAKINYSIAGGANNYLLQNDEIDALSVFPESQVIGQKCYMATLVVTKLSENENEQFTTLTGSQLIELDSNFQDSHINAPLGKSLHMGGGFLRSYDSKNWTETGFHFYPDITLTVVTGSGGSIEIGSYLYYAVYYWMNEKGDIERSAPSIPATVNIVANNSLVDVSVSCLNITQKQNVRIELYRTLKNPPANAPAYLVKTAANVVNFLEITIQDPDADATIANNEILYTTGGILENIPPNCANLVDSYKNRIVTNDSQDKNLTWISKEYVPGQNVNFNPFLTFRTNDIGGEITGYKQLDDKLLIFKQNLIFFTSGQGPNNTGTDFGLFPPELIASDTGCDSHSSIVLTPVGVMFKSAKGFYLMNRSLQLEYVGYDVESFNNQTITAATMVEYINQVRFLTDSGLTLVYDYLYKQWSTFTNHEGKDAVMWNGVYTYLRNNGAVWTENEGSHLDFNTNFRLKIVSPWIKLVQNKMQASALGPQSFFRVRRFALLGRYSSRHILQVGLSYDYRPDVQQTYYFDTEQRLAGPAGQYGNDAYYGETTPYGGDDGADVVYQFRARTARQKCESIQFIIEDIPQPTNGESYGITDLSIEVGIKKGINKLGARKTVPGS
jgi:hypothetical protein